MRKTFSNKNYLPLSSAIFIALLIFAAILSAYFNTATKKLDREEALIQSFKSSGGQFQKAVITCCLKINNDFMELGAVEDQIDNIIRKINPDEKTIIKKIETKQNIIKANVTCQKSNKTYNISVESVKTGEKSESYMISDIVIEKNINDLVSEGKMVRKMYGRNLKYTDISMSIAGAYNGRLNTSQIKDKIAVVLKSVKGKKVEALQSHGINSVSAFSNQVDGYIKSGGKNINIQVALRYSPLYDKTYIWIATPLINVEY